jgi:hypothetical protein
MGTAVIQAMAACGMNSKCAAGVNALFGPEAAGVRFWQQLSERMSLWPQWPCIWKQQARSAEDSLTPCPAHGTTGTMTYRRSVSNTAIWPARFMP